jgi:hypothetical protein
LFVREAAVERNFPGRKVGVASERAASMAPLDTFHVEEKSVVIGRV